MASVTANFARDRADATPVTLRQLLAMKLLATSTALMAGESGIDATVVDVKAGSINGSSSTLRPPPGVLSVVDGRHLRRDTYQVDMAIREVYEHGGTGIIICTDRSNIALAAIRLANKFKVPVVVADGIDPIVLTDELRRIVQAPRLVRSSTLLAAVESLHRSSTNAPMDQSLARLGEALDAQLGLISAEGTLVSGMPNAAGALLTLRDVVTETVLADTTIISQPINLARKEPASFWLLASVASPTASQISIVKDALLISSWFFATRLVADRLERERDARFRMGVLSSILSGKERFEPVLKEHLALLQWKVDGWCSAIHWQASGDVDSLRVLSLTDQLSRALTAQGLTGPLVERPDGWTSWIVSAEEPSASTYPELAASVDTALTSFLALAPRLRLHVGIGRPYVGLDGLRTSLAESKEAATIAQAAGGLRGVQHIDAMGVRRILLGWYTSDSFAEFAHTLLAPLLAVDADGILLQTLEIYLDEESSATVAAQVLSVHRNTILNRVERLRSLLTVDLDDAEERLAVQLACRVVKLKRDNAAPR